jgi:prophage tail gpP-like protein
LYKVVTGDTFELIARKSYGVETQADRIARANPGVFEPIPAGVTITIPALPGAPQDIPQSAQSDNLDEVALSIDGKRYRFWEGVTINRSMDSMDTVSFGAPFDPDAPGFRETFRPFSFKPVNITVGGDPLFTGTMININPVLENDRKSISVSGYSLPGVLNDCMAPASAFPLEFDGQGLREISTTLSSLFGIDVDFTTDQGAIFDRVGLEPTKKVLGFLADLAKQRNLVISSTPLGKLLFQQSVSVGSPVAVLRQGESPVLFVSPAFNPQDYYSHIVGLESVFMGLAGGQFTVKNPRLEGVIRPFTFTLPDTIEADIQRATEAKAGRMFGNAVSYTLRVDTWRDPLGKLWTPNTTLKLIAPGAMIYNEYEFIIRSISFQRERSTNTATLNLVIPGSFSGKIPEVLPWDE